MSICPKSKSSRGRRDKRRANWKMTAPTLVKCSKCGALTMPHRVCEECGSYNKREIISVDQFLELNYLCKMTTPSDDIWWGCFLFDRNFLSI